MKDKGAWRQDHWVRQMVSLIIVCRDCGTDVAEHMVWKMRCAGASNCLIYLVMKPKLSKGKLQDTDCQIWSSEGSQWMFRIKWMLGYVLTGWPLPHLHYLFCAVRYLIKQKCHKTRTSDLFRLCIYILSQGQFSWGNNNSSKRMNLASFTVQQNKLDSHKAGTLSQKRLFAELV